MSTALFTSSGTWNAPDGVSSVTAQCWGAGGGGAEASSGTGSGGAGGGGEFAQATVAVTPGSPYTVTVGAAGAGGSGAEGSGNGANGANGGNTTFPGDSVTVTAHGGKGGAFNPKPSGTGTGGAGGTGSSNQIHFDGGAGGSGNAAGQGGGGGSSAGGSSAGNAGGNSTGAGSITIVQSAQSVTLGTSGTVTLASPTTAGNCLVAVIQSPSVHGINQFVSGVTIGGLSDNWMSLVTYGSSGSWTVCSYWADPNCTSGQTSVRVSCGGGTGTLSVAVSVFEVAGLVTTSLLDQTAGVLNNTGSSWSSGSTGVTSQAAEIAFGNAGAAAPMSGPGSPWVNLAQQNDGVGDYSIVGYDILASTGAQVYSGTLSGSALYTAAIATLKGSGGTSGSPGAAVVLGGPGGTGAGSGAVGSAPVSGPGGGGGASASSNKDGGAGFAGQVILTWSATPTPPPVPNPPVEIPGPTASVLAAITGGDPSNPYNAADPTQRRQATVSGSNTPVLPSLMTDVVFMPEFAILDANITVTGTISAEAGVDVTIPGEGLSVVEGTNCKQGTATLVSGSAVVQNTSVTASSRIFLTGQADGTAPGWLRVSTRAPGVSFTVTSSSGTDTSTFAFEIYEPG